MLKIFLHGRRQTKKNGRVIHRYVFQRMTHDGLRNRRSHCNAIPQAHTYRTAACMNESNS